MGLLPATIGPYVIRAMGEQNARRYFVTAEIFTDVEAKAMGFVHELVELESLDSKVLSLCEGIINNGALAVMACKKMVRDLSHQPITPELIDETVRRIAAIRTGPEAQALMKAFLEKVK